MNLIIDVILILIIVFSVISGVRKGFINSIMNMITFAVALMCGWNFYPALGEYYKERIFLQRITNEISSYMSSFADNALDSLFQDMPEALTQITDRFGIDIASLEAYYNSHATIGTSEISSFIANPVAENISNILAFVTIFLGVIIILKIVTLILDLIFKLPVLNTLNRVCGFILGVFNGFLYAALFSAVLALLSPILTALIPEMYTSAMIDSSVFVTLINKLNIALK
jgi:Colicin V production protein.